MERARIISTGYYLPEKVLTNFDLEKMVDTSDEWIRTRTGIVERRIAGDDESASSMGVIAGERAIKNSGIKKEEIDAIICATITPDYAFFPSTACIIQRELGLKNAYAFDISAACSGFIYALTIAEGLLLTKRANKVLVIATEKMSAITDWQDRSTCVLFGDGAGACILTKENGNRGILSSFLGSDGTLAELLIVPAGGSKNPINEENIKDRMHYLKMRGNEVFKAAVHRMIEASIKSIELAGLKSEDIDLLIPHQANLRIISAIAKRLNLHVERGYVNLDRTGNTSAACIAIALGEAVEKGIIKENSVINLVSFGAGFTWAGMVIRM